MYFFETYINNNKSRIDFSKKSFDNNIMKIFLTIIHLLFFLSIDNYANAQVRLNACGVDGRPTNGFFTKNCNDTNSSKSSTSGPTSISSLPDNIICNRASEGKIEYILEAKKRKLPCMVQQDRNEEKQYGDTSHLTDKDVCYRATVINKDPDTSYKSVKWETNPNYARFVTEAKNRGLSCGVNLSFKEAMNKGLIKNPLSGVEDNRVCNKASEGAIEYILEAKRRGLNECIDQEYYVRMEQIIKQREEEERRKRNFIINLSDPAG